MRKLSHIFAVWLRCNRRQRYEKKTILRILAIDNMKRTLEDIQLELEDAKKRLIKAKSAAALTTIINEISRLTWLLSLYEHNPSDKVSVCVIAQAPKDAPTNAAARVAEGYCTWTHMKAWPTVEKNEIIIFPVDYSDLIMVLSDLDERGFSCRIEEKDT